MFHNQILFITLFITYFIAILYLTYFICNYNNYIGSSAKKMNMLKKIILAYIFPTLCVIFIALILTYFGFISPYTLLINFLAGAIFMLAVVCFCESSIYWGILLIFVSILGGAALYIIDFIEVPQKEEIVKVQLVPYTENAIEMESILLIFDNNTSDTTDSSTSDTNDSINVISEIESTDEFDNDSQEKIELYSFLMYDKTSLKQKGIKLPISLYTDKYQTTEKDENFIEIKINKIEIMNIYEYFEFLKPNGNTKNSYDYRIVINEENLKIY